MDEVKVIEIKKSIFEANEKDAKSLQEELKKKQVYLLNVMSSPGSGKTTTLIKIINDLKDKYRIAVMEADIDSSVDGSATATSSTKFLNSLLLSITPWTIDESSAVKFPSR